jgi:hypothetical protein
LPFKVPYPVPFKLLGDEAKGWLDTTYLSPTGTLRISKGNKVCILLQSKIKLLFHCIATTHIIVLVFHICHLQGLSLQ